MRLSGRILPALTGAVLLAALLVCFHDRLPRWKSRAQPRTAASPREQCYEPRLEQPFWKGKVAWDEINYDADKPGSLQVTGRFIGCDPMEIIVHGYIRETPDGAESPASHTSFSRPLDNATRFRFEFENAPVTAPTLYFRVYGIQKGYKKPIPYALADFTLTNPLHLRVEPWQTEPLPATRKIGPLTVELTGVNSAPPSGVQCSGNSQLRLRVFEKGVATYQWRVMGIESSSGLGNTVLQQGPAYRGYGLGTAIATDDIHTILWKCLAPWKIKVSLMKIADFRPEEIIEIRDISVPAEGQAIQLDQKWNIEGQEVAFVQIAKGEPMVLGWNRNMTKNSVTMHFTLPDQEYWWLKLLSVSDADGKVLWEPEEEFVVREKSDRRNAGYVFGPGRMTLPPKFSCKFGVVRERREAEFIINPTYEGKPFRPKVETP